MFLFLSSSINYRSNFCLLGTLIFNTPLSPLNLSHITPFPTLSLDAIDPSQLKASRTRSPLKGTGSQKTPTMCHDVFTILSCGCKHFEGVEFCHDAIFSDEGQACPPENRTPRQHIRPDSDPRVARSCGKDPCPTQLAKDHDEKLRLSREEVAMQYARGERMPNGGQLGRPGVWDEFETKARVLATDNEGLEESGDTNKGKDKIAELEGKDNDGYRYRSRGSYRPVPGATNDINSGGKANEKSIGEFGRGYEPVSDHPVSEKQLGPKSSRYSLPATAPIPIANPVTYPRKDSLDLGRDFHVEFDKDMVAIFGEGAGDPKRARSNTGPPGLGSEKAQLLGTARYPEENIECLINKVNGVDLGEKQYGRDTGMILTRACDDEGFWMSPRDKDGVSKDA